MDTLVLLTTRRGHTAFGRNQMPRGDRCLLWGNLFGNLETAAMGRFCGKYTCSRSQNSPEAEKPESAFLVRLSAFAAAQEKDLASFRRFWAVAASRDSSFVTAWVHVVGSRPRPRMRL